MKRKTLKNKIHNYISKKKDICCENEYDRKLIIQQIIEKYKHMCKLRDEPEDTYIYAINNDIFLFIGYLVYLKKNKDTEGVKLWNELDKQMLKNKKVNAQKIEQLLQDLPLYCLLSFLGSASYKESYLVEIDAKYPR